MTNDDLKKGTKVLSRDGKQEGELTGGRRRCKLAGCTGIQVGVRWGDKKVTFPCTKGLEPRGETLQVV